MDDLASLDFNASQGAAQNGGKSAFDYLSRPSSVPARVASPNLLQPAQNATPSPRVGSPLPSEDAFSSLLGPSTGKSPQIQSLSMAERLRQTSASGLSSGRASPAQLPVSSTWDFDLLSPAVSASSSHSASVSPRVPAAKIEANEDDDIFGLDSLAPPASSSAKTTTVHLANGDDGADILGDLAAPPSRPTSSLSNGRDSTPVASSSRAPSPPPHVLGKLVEMGFGIEQAKTALSATYAGNWNVQAAAEALMGAAEHEQRERQVSRDAALARESIREERAQPRGDDWSDEERRRRHAERRRPTKPLRDVDRLLTPKNDEQPDLLAQASEIGLTVFNKASAYWQTGRKVVQKAVEERIAATQAGPSSAPTANGAPRRPKWMTAGLPDEEQPVPVRRKPSPVAAAQTEEPPPTLFRDDDVEPPAKAVKRQPEPAQPHASTSAHRYKAAEEPKAYVSAHRHRVPQRSTPSPVPAAPTRPSRPVISATPAQLASAESHKGKGNELFKLGRYGDAEISYSLALQALPEKHLSRVPLLTNRAQSRLHNGEPKGASDDCTLALVLLGVDGTEASLFALSVASEHESAGKALGRRAKAFEAEEKWSSALSDWSLAQRAGNDVLRGAGGAKVVAEGAARCRRAIDPPPKPVVKTAPARKRTVTTSGAAVAAVREANKAADAEDAEKLTLKDSVDERLTAWKGGKETNIRALIASLDVVLWDGFGWQKVGLHELVTESQLKIRYMKAISRLHPDKLNPSNTTVEERMIANGVFGALNDAWTAHKPL